MYSIRGLCHRTDVPLGRHGFVVDLAPGFPEIVAKSKLTEENINTLIMREGRLWLDRTDFGKLHAGKPLYEPGESLRVGFGKWGIEHITVPGDACGLDLDDNDFGCPFYGGRCLVPHNVDALRQKYLLLIVFTEITAVMFSLAECPPAI